MTASPKTLRTALKKLRLTADQRAQRNQQIADRLLGSSRTITTPDFTEITDSDLQCLFEGYDSEYFDGVLKHTLADTPLAFRVSSRMTKAGGKTASWRRGRQSPIERFEIAVSSTLLLQTFTADDEERAILVTGLQCRHRLDALMRVLEHELIHLAELLGWHESSCRRERFQTIAWQVFGHTDHRHSLITPRERAAAAGVQPGALVRFEYQGRQLAGVVNRITRRATVLVPDRNGELFSDGNTYCRYYVPVNTLEPVEPTP